VVKAGASRREAVALTAEHDAASSSCYRMA
jgi:hypothetical protein